MPTTTKRVMTCGCGEQGCNRELTITWIDRDTVIPYAVLTLTGHGSEVTMPLLDEQREDLIRFISRPQ